MTTSDAQLEVIRAIRIIESQLAQGMSLPELATILQHELRTCSHLVKLFPGWT